MHILSITLFAVSANVDAFLIGMSYILSGIYIPVQKNFIISIISGIGTALAMLTGTILSRWIHPQTGNIIGSLLLILTGCWMILSFFRKRKASVSYKEPDVARCQELTSESMTADAIYPGHTAASGSIKEEAHITIKQSLYLAALLTLNNLSLGFAASIAGLPILTTAVAAALTGFLLLMAGQISGKKWFSKMFGEYASLFSGVLIFMLGLYEMFM